MVPLNDPTVNLDTVDCFKVVIGEIKYPLRKYAKGKKQQQNIQRRPACIWSNYDFKEIQRNVSFEGI